MGKSSLKKYKYYEQIKPWMSKIKVGRLDILDSLCDQIQLMRDSGIEIYPSQEDILKPFELCSPSETKVIIIGNEPSIYPGESNGLAYSILGNNIHPTLKNIFTELESDLGIKVSGSGDLTPWAKQGVLLVNQVLTVEKGKLNSHKYLGWQIFTLNAVKSAAKLRRPIVVMLWGAEAQNFVKYVKLYKYNNCLVIRSSKPSKTFVNASMNGIESFSGSRPFSRANEWLQSRGREPVDWSI